MRGEGGSNERVSLCYHDSHLALEHFRPGAAHFETSFLSFGGCKIDLTETINGSKWIQRDTLTDKWINIQDLKFCFIHVVKFHLFKNYVLIFTPFLFSHLFSFPPLSYFPCFPFISWFGDKFSLICESILSFLEDFLDFCRCNKSFDFDLCNPFWTMN